MKKVVPAKKSSPRSYSIPTIILCGGQGTRLKEETEFKPKPMVDVGGRPILWHIMKIYSSFGYNNFLFALGFKGSFIKDYFLRQKYYEADFSINTIGLDTVNFLNHNDLEKENFRITFAETGLDTPTGERVLRMAKYIKGDIFMVTYGDGVADIDIDKLIAFHKKSKVIATITGVHPTSRWGMINTDDSNIVKEFAQKPLLYDYINGGFMVLDKKFLDYIKPGDMIEETLMRLVPNKKVALYKHEGFWYAMDTYRDFTELNKMWNDDPKWKIWES